MKRKKGVFQSNLGSFASNVALLKKSGFFDVYRYEVGDFSFLGVLAYIDVLDTASLKNLTLLHKEKECSSYFCQVHGCR